MKDIVKKVIDEWNPYSLLPDAPDDEFDIEIKKVTESLINCITAEELAISIQAIFSSSFGQTFGYEECLKQAEQIWKMTLDDN